MAMYAKDFLRDYFDDIKVTLSEEGSFKEEYDRLLETMLLGVNNSAVLSSEQGEYLNYALKAFITRFIRSGSNYKIDEYHHATILVTYINSCRTYS